MPHPAPYANRPAAILPDTWTETLKSANGVSYQVSVAVPKGPVPEQGFAVIYLLDANASFATVVETHRRLSRRPDATGVGAAVIVGIGHDTEALYDTRMRQRDFTPAQSAGPNQSDGGADEFLEVIQTQVQPLICQEFAADPRRQILAGHSLAAFFTLWVLARQPEAFQGYIALSPSLWWDPTLIEALTSRSSLPNDCSVYLAVGEWEEALAPWQLGQPGSDDIRQRRVQRRMVSNVQECARRLAAKLPPDRLLCQIFADEDHASVFAIGISKAMRMML